MFWRTSKVGKNYQLFLAILGILAVLLVETTLDKVPQTNFEIKLRAAKLAQKAQREILNEAKTRKVFIDPLSDPNATGLIGEQFTLITTDHGDLTSKLTVTDPNWAGVVVELLKKAGLKREDYVAVNWTGSMPGLNIAVLSAIEEMELNPVIITSVGASMWGANNPDFTWLDMEKLLFDRGIFKHRSVAASIGGKGDRGENISPKGRELCKNAILRNAVELIEEPSLEKSIKTRMRIFEKSIPSGKKYKAFVNVGGGAASLGSVHNEELIGPGLTKRIPPVNYPVKGVIVLFGEQGLPVINFSDIGKLAEMYGMPIAPVPLPESPSGGVFYVDKYNVLFVAITLAVYAAIVFTTIRLDIRKVFSASKRV